MSGPLGWNGSRLQRTPAGRKRTFSNASCPIEAEGVFRCSRRTARSFYPAHPDAPANASLASRQLPPCPMAIKQHKAIGPRPLQGKGLPFPNFPGFFFPQDARVPPGPGFPHRGRQRVLPYPFFKIPLCPGPRVCEIPCRDRLNPPKPFAPAGSPWPRFRTTPSRWRRWTRDRPRCTPCSPPQAASCTSCAPEIPASWPRA